MNQEDFDDDLLDDPELDELAAAYEGPIPEVDDCFLCFATDVPRMDRWNFQLVDEDNNPVQSGWLCRHCHSQFDSVEAFDKFRNNTLNRRLYSVAARLQRLLLLNAPPSIISQTVLGCLAGPLFSPDEIGGSDAMRNQADADLARLVERRKD